MYNKLAAIILNSAKSSGLSDVFIAQPDAAKENLAGKIFVLAEIGGKKNEGKKIFDFLVKSLSDNYYNDEKILFREKIEGLKLENIFEAAVAKTNKSLTEFLDNEKIRINPETTSLTLGLVYQNKLHFAGFGRNRALLIYRRAEKYELINVEANAAETLDVSAQDEASTAQAPQLFSSLISGEIPAASYFMFTSEALPEYLSGQEMINIITKLPPMTAAEQIKNVLAKINTYVPFLGIIIKNTVGLPLNEIREEQEYASSSAQGSISSLNYTEQKTEEMLAPAGLINFSNFFKKSKKFLSTRLAAFRLPKFDLASSLKSSSTSKYQEELQESRKISSSQAEKSIPGQELSGVGQVRSLQTARQDSFLIKEKIFFKKKSGWIFMGLKKLGDWLAGAFNPRFWLKAAKNIIPWLKSLSRQRLLLFSALGALIIVLVLNMAWGARQSRRQAAEEYLNNLISSLEDKEDAIDFYLLYNDEAGAMRTLIEAQAILDAWPQDSKEQKAAYENVAEKLKANAEKVQKIERVHEAELIAELNDLEANNLVLAGDRLYAGGQDKIREIPLNNDPASTITLSGNPAISQPFFSDGNIIYYWNKDQVLAFNRQNGTNNAINFTVGAEPPAITGFKFYSRYFYTLSPEEGQIHRYNYSGNAIGAKTDWLTESRDLSAARDLYVDGNIYILNKDGQVLKFYLNKEADFNSAPLSPLMSEANEIIVANNYIYVFEGASRRLALLNKEDGRLVKQYIIDGLEETLDFAPHETEKNIYFLSQNKVYRIPMNP